MRWNVKFRPKDLMRKLDLLLLSITSNSSSDSSNCTTNTVLQSVAIVRKLTLSFGSFALGVLLLAFLLQPLSTK